MWQPRSMVLERELAGMYAEAETDSVQQRGFSRVVTVNGTEKLAGAGPQSYILRSVLLDMLFHERAGWHKHIA